MGTHARTDKQMRIDREPKLAISARGASCRTPPVSGRRARAYVCVGQGRGRAAPSAGTTGSFRPSAMTQANVASLLCGAGPCPTAG
jgi:hypothetical protein